MYIHFIKIIAILFAYTFSSAIFSETLLNPDGYIDDNSQNILSNDTREPLQPLLGIGEQIQCTLVVQDADSTIENEEFARASVNYDPHITGSWSERFIFNWPSSVPGFGEKTVRIKS